MKTQLRSKVWGNGSLQGSNDNQESSWVHESGEQQLGFMKTSLDSWYFLWKHVAHRIWGIAKLFLPSAQNSSPGFGPYKCPSCSSSSRAHLSNGAVTLCTPLSTGGWLQLCSPPTSHSCVRLPLNRRNASEDTHTARPEMSKHFLFWRQTDPVCLLGWRGVCQLKEQITDKKQMGKRNQRNTTHGPEFSDTSIKRKSLHINMVYSYSSQGWCGMGKGLLNEAGPVQILALSTCLQSDRWFPSFAEPQLVYL